MGFNNLLENVKNQLLETRLYYLKCASKKVVWKTGEFLGNKMADTVTNSYNDKIVKTKSAEERTILLEKKRRNIKPNKTYIIKNQYKIW